MAIEPVSGERLVRLLNTKGQEWVRETYGGKALGLAKVYKWIEVHEVGTGVPNLQLEVPEFWVLPCSATFQRPQVDLGDLMGGKYRYAVRSGAPESMPGMMETKLNVPRTNIYQAINSVWDSYHSPQAVAYRDAHNFDHYMGTGVVIMEMFLSPNWSGVAFSVGGEREVEKKFGLEAPLVQVVEGYGDKLVGGQENAVDLGQSNLLTVIRHLLDVMELKESSWVDVEWALKDLGKVRRLAIFQLRKLKVQKVVSFLSDEAQVGTKIIAQGKSIGAMEVRKVDRIYLIDSNNIPDPSVLSDLGVSAIYCDDFLPQLYPLMVKSAGLVCKTGSDTCHAALVAKDPAFPKPAISGITYHQLPPNMGDPTFVPGPFILDPTESCIRLPIKGKDYSTVTVTPGNGFQVPVEWEPDSLWWEWEGYNLRDLPLSSNVSFMADSYNRVPWIATRFYVWWDRYNRGLVTKAQFDQVAKEIGDCLGSAVFWMCCQESRHYNKRSTDGVFLKELGLEDESVSEAQWRVYLWHSGLPKLHILRCIDRLFNIHWTAHGAYGGKRWGEITTLLLELMEGKISYPAWIDKAFNIQHNGGFAYNKFNWLNEAGDSYHGAMVDLLNAKRIHGIPGMVKVGGPLHVWMGRAGLITPHTTNQLEWLTQLDKFLMRDRMVKKFGVFPAKQIKGEWI